MTTLFALEGSVSKGLLTFGGRVIVHDNRDELEYIIGRGATVISCPDYVKAEEQLSIKDHPDFASYQWPLDRRHFNNG